MANETKGITVRIDAGLHAQVREYVESHGMTMAEFVSQALDNELHPKYQLQEASTMANTRTVAFQVPEDLVQWIKEYLVRNNMTQRQFFLGLIEAELDREQNERHDLQAAESAKADPAKTEEAENEAGQSDPDQTDRQAVPEEAPDPEEGAPENDLSM